ncbi:hypothetical protein IHQ68_05820 [Chelatococcus sambhunathii]|uniref:Uncharacterized protein n=2 Tax=Chelatococcus sambhunathii TaxID=363953 RepID=A0ABU1DDL3_9HYPH|nr:hypothetical protein [Chelatococcus sambhunathii]
MVALVSGAALACVCLVSPAAAAVKKQSKTINGVKVDLYSWKDSTGFKRSVALKKQGEGNPGNGGYAVQMTFDDIGGVQKANAPKGDGFGYFVSHERYRAFTDGDSNTIAGKIFKTDDSPLGRNFPVETSYGADETSFKSVTFSTVYGRYGTKKPGGIDANTGEDKPKIGLKKKLFERYDIPVKLTWFFEDGKTYPRLRVEVDLSKTPGPDHVSFDLRAPYGKLDFDGGDNPIQYVTWGDRFKFQNTDAPITRNSRWIWNVPNTDAARYNALVSNGKEMGLVEPKLYTKSALNDGYSDGRGETYATHDAAAAGCAGQELPCDYEWPYQSSQYELPYDDPNGATTSEKIAWGSTPFYGMSISSTFDGVSGVPFNGFPKKKKIVYDVCVVFGPHVAGGLARSIAEKGGDYDCARAK